MWEVIPFVGPTSGGEREKILSSPGLSSWSGSPNSSFRKQTKVGDFFLFVCFKQFFVSKFPFLLFSETSKPFEHGQKQMHPFVWHTVKMFLTQSDPKQLFVNFSKWRRMDFPVLWQSCVHKDSCTQGMVWNGCCTPPPALGACPPQ